MNDKKTNMGADEFPFVTVIVPCRNEGRFIGECLESILKNDYPAERMEVLVVDGMSDDETRSVVGEYARRSPNVKLLDNPDLVTPYALNTGVRNARGELIIWMSAHNRYENNYVSLCVSYSQRFDADNVGGTIVTLPRTPGAFGKAVANALSHPFGVGNSHFRIRPENPKWVDTVFGGCYKKSVFEKIGLFNERLTRGQDLELNLRLKRGGGGILLVPEIVSYYYARSDFGTYWEHNWTNGVWAILPFSLSKIVPVSLRHLVPMFFVLSLLASGAAALAWKQAQWIFLGILATYLILNLLASIQAAIKSKNGALLVTLPFAFVTLHISYGLGSLWGACRALGNFFRRKS